MDTNENQTQEQLEATPTSVPAESVSPPVCSEYQNVPVNNQNQSAPIYSNQMPHHVPPAYPPYYYPQQPYVPPKPYVYQKPAPPAPAAPKASVPFPPVPESKEKQTGGTPLWKKLLAGGLVFALVVCSCGITAAIVERRITKKNEAMNLYYNDKITVLEQQVQNNTNRTNEKLDSMQSQIGGEGTVSGPMTPAQVYAQNVGSVVAINCSTTSTNGATYTSSGSGFVFTEDGYIVSNYHVVEGANQLTVTFSDGTEHSASYVGGDDANDIALIKIEATGLRPVTVGRSDDLIVGSQVAAIGNPLGELASTLTVGFLSAKDRVIISEGSQINMMQTDAAINPGNSGGPLFNMNGEVVGITTAKYSGTTASGASIEGIGFAIPMDDVLEMLNDLKEHGYITGAFLGITVSNVTPEDSKLYGLPLGALVHEVSVGNCAQKAGVRAQDIIVELGGYKIENMNDLTRALRKFDAGQTVSMVVYRHSQGGQVVLSVTLDEKPVSATPAVTPSVGSGMPSGGTADEWFNYFFN